ncbi:DUF1090 domain-containing protein [Candidatus Sodalis sp. SoCistrobi]|uniref:DUF1090 domain-containing protein n=1 Tax=Candidatus Sodalis sp. SoCistrobi TaxID=1922216 RepID=UPI00093D9FA3|nr:DUF1090 domain-containing protein [Candidatus Sodalis sp. SoCistrobi]
MKSTLSYLTLIGFMLVFPSQNALAASGCAAKQQSVQQQLSHARAQGNTARAEGLEKAMSEITAHCRDDQLQADRQRHVADKKSKLAQRQRELAEAQQTGNSDKINKKQKKVARAEQELAEAQSALTQ